jgi:type III pantothenate kinase
MKLILDFGNTLQKIAVFDKNQMIAFKAFSKISLKEIKKFIINYPIHSAIISSVINYPNEIKEFLLIKFNLIEFSENTPIPINNLYKTPETLGKDRLSAVIAANSISINRSSLVINAGTCITYDFVDNNSTYYGGAISPGLFMRFKALHTFTEKLPLITKIKSQNPLIGSTTEESIFSGVLNGTLSEIEGIISKYKEKYADLLIILSGGDMKYFDKKIKNSIFAYPNIVMFGLNIILDFNAKK